MGTQTRQYGDPALLSIVGGAAVLVRGDPRILGVTVVGALLGVVPLVGWLLALVMNGLATGLAARTIHDGSEPSHLVDYRLVALVAASIVAGILLGIGLVLLVIPGVYLLVRFYLYPAAVVVDDMGPLEALSESWERTSGHFPTIFGFVAVIVLGSLALALVLAFLLGSGQLLEYVQTVEFRLVAGVVTSPVAAVGAAGIAIMYDVYGPDQDARDAATW